MELDWSAIVNEEWSAETILLRASARADEALAAATIIMSKDGSFDMRFSKNWKPTDFLGALELLKATYLAVILPRIQP